MLEKWINVHINMSNNICRSKDGDDEGSSVSYEASIPFRLSKWRSLKVSLNGIAQADKWDLESSLFISSGCPQITIYVCLRLELCRDVHVSPQLPPLFANEVCLHFVNKSKSRMPNMK